MNTIKLTVLHSLIPLLLLVSQNALAAFDLLGGPVIAVDFGTATTFDCVSKEGEYLGGVIFPGIHTSTEALFERASMLHRVEIVRPKSVIWALYWIWFEPRLISISTMLRSSDRIALV